MAEKAHTNATTEASGHAPAEHVEATALGLNAGGWVALAMILVFAILLWKRVPASIASALDGKIAAIRAQLDEAKQLREEAEALKKEYQKKAKTADKEAKAMIERAHHEAEAIVAKANTDAEALIARRSRMAEDKIAAEERTALKQLRAAAAGAAARAAARLIAEHDDPAADEQLVNRTIAELPGR